MAKGEWVLPSGLGVRVDGGIRVRWPGAKEGEWIMLSSDMKDAEDLFAVLAVEVPRTRKGGS